MLQVLDTGVVVLQGSKLTVSGGITNSHVSSTAAIAATKQEHQPRIDYQQAPGTAVVAATRDIHIVAGATGTVRSIKAAITTTIATGADRTVTIDLQKSTGAAAFATVMSSTIVLNNVSVLRTAVNGTLDSAQVALVAGDILRLVITVAGAAGNQADGLVISVSIDEATG